MSFSKTREAHSAKSIAQSEKDLDAMRFALCALPFYVNALRPTVFCYPVRDPLHLMPATVRSRHAYIDWMRGLACVPRVMRAKSAFGNDELEGLAELERRVGEELDGLAKDGQNGEKRT